MIMVKIFTKKERFGQYPAINILLIQKQPICSTCNKPIEDKSHVYLCSNMDKIWHKECFNDNHVKEEFTKIAGLDHHYDYGCKLRIVTADDFDGILADEKKAYIDIVS